MAKQEKEQAESKDRYQLGQIVGDTKVYVIDTENENQPMTDEEVRMLQLNLLDKIAKSLS